MSSEKNEEVFRFKNFLKQFKTKLQEKEEILISFEHFEEKQAEIAPVSDCSKAIL